MILDNIQHSASYEALGEYFMHAFDFIRNTDLTSLAHGKHLIAGDNLFVIIMEYETKRISECIMENHRKYIDIQYMIRGEELMGVKTFANDVPVTPYDETKDAAFYQPEPDSLIKVRQGHFAIFFPQDLHMPCIKVSEPQKVLKAVFKLKR